MTPFDRSRFTRATGQALLLLSATWLGGCTAIAANSPSASEPAQVVHQTLVQPGQIMPLRHIVGIDDKDIPLDVKGRKKLVVLFATWCSDSQRAMKALAASPLLDQDIEIVAIAREQQREEVQQWQQKTGYRIPLAVDPDRSIYRQFASGGIPRFIMVDENNTVVGSVLAEGEQQLAQIRW